MSAEATGGTKNSRKKKKILEEDESQLQTEEQGDTIKGNDAPVEKEDTREGVKESLTCPVQVKGDDTTTESEHAFNFPVSCYLKIPEQVETDDGHISIVLTSKLVKEEMVREWVNLSISNTSEVLPSSTKNLENSSKRSSISSDKREVPKPIPTSNYTLDASKLCMLVILKTYH